MSNITNMTEHEKQLFLSHTREVIKRYPELQKDVILAMDAGVQEHIKDLRQQTADFETVAVAFMSLVDKPSKSTKLWANTLIFNKLKKYEKCSFMNWSVDIGALEQKLLEEGLIRKEES